MKGKQMDKYIIDDKTCMVRWNGERLDPKWMEIRNWIHAGGVFDTSKLANWFRRQPISSKHPPEFLSQEEHQKLKAVFGVLQVGCVVMDHMNRLAVFKRPKKEKSGVSKITAGYSIFRSWSPTEINMRATQQQFTAHTGFRHGDRLELTPFGAGYNELPLPDRFSPAYLFVIYKAVCASASFPTGIYGETDKKAGNELVNFYPPETLWQGQEKDGEETITFEGGMDRLILETIACQKSSARSGYLAEFNTACRVSDENIIFRAASDSAFGNGLSAGTVRKFFTALGQGSVEIAKDVISSMIKQSIGIQ
jgi:hypothetical protein